MAKNNDRYIGLFFSGITTQQVYLQEEPYKKNNIKLHTAIDRTRYI